MKPRFLLVALLIAVPAFASTVTTTVELSKLGNGKNSVYYFNSGGILYGFLEGQEFNTFALETITGRAAPMTATGEAQTITTAPPGYGDKTCVEWNQRCWESAAAQISVCSARCTKIKVPDSEEIKDAGPPKQLYLTISSSSFVLN